MHEERLLILKMVESGKITAQEAAELWKPWRKRRRRSRPKVTMFGAESRSKVKNWQEDRAGG